MRILQVMNNMHAGGAEQYVAQLTSYLVAQGDELVVVADGPLIIRDRFPAVTKVVLMSLYPSSSARRMTYYLGLPRRIVALYRLIRQENIQLVHTHLAVSAVPAWIAAALAGVPVLHSKMHTQIIASGSERALFRSPLPAWCVSKFVVFSGYAAAEAQRIWHLPNERLVHSSIAINTQYYDPNFMSISAARAHFGIADDVFVVAIVARLSPEKEVDLALAGFAEMLKRAANAVLLIAGDGVSRPLLERLSIQLGIADRVRFLGRQLDTRPVYRAANVVMQTTRGPNMGMIALEAFAMGVPLLIAARDEEEVTMAIDTLGGYEVGLIAKAQAEPLGAALAEMAAQPEKWRACGEPARHYAQTVHGLDQVLARLRESYKQAIQQAKS